MSRLTDPPIRKDGRCALCKKPIETIPRPGVPPLLYVDPFCSSQCCKAYYDVPIEAPAPKGKRKYGSREEAK